jgi:hypothetical protein
VSKWDPIAKKMGKKLSGWKLLYLQLRSDRIYPYRFIWKIKMPLKVKVFMWLVLKNCILTKDNLMRRGWTGNSQCHLCSSEENMSHLLFECTFVRFVWQMLVCAFGFVRPPESAADMLGVWIGSFPAPLRKNILCGCTAVCWTIWKTRNDACFNRKFPAVQFDIQTLQHFESEKPRQRKT